MAVQGPSVTNCWAGGSATTSSARLLANFCACGRKAHEACSGHQKEYYPILSGSICTRDAINEMKTSPTPHPGMSGTLGATIAPDGGADHIIDSSDAAVSLPTIKSLEAKPGSIDMRGLVGSEQGTAHLDAVGSQSIRR